jgi:predicted amidohydrolase YtcJ
MRAETLFFNGSFHTLDPTRPRATAIAVSGERIVAVGGDELHREIRAQRMIDLGGLTVVPGFNDAHNHMLSFGTGLADIDISSPPMHSVGDICDAVAERAARTPVGGWVIGSRYDQNKLAEQRHPHVSELDTAAPNHRVWLRHTSGHMCVVNSAVVRSIIDRPVPAGGQLGVDDDGTINGLVLEQAQRLITQLVAPLDVDTMVQALADASRHYLSEGVTSATEAGVGASLISPSPHELQAWRLAAERGVLGVRTNLLIGIELLNALSEATPGEFDPGTDDLLTPGARNDWLRVGGTKIFSDGSLIGRTAAMYHPFEADPHGGDCGCGMFQTEPELLRRLILDAHRRGWQVCTHAIGDRAVATVLDCYAEALRSMPRSNARHRIEHCGVISEDLIDKVAGLGVIPVPQGRFIGEIGDGMKHALGEHRTPDCYRQRSFLEHGIALPGSSDRPVVNGAPLLGIHDMVNQKTDSGEPFVPAEALTVDQAVGAYTRGSAYAAFDEHRKGTLRADMLADFVVLDRDIFDIDRDGIRETRVVATVTGGSVVYDNGLGTGTKST